MSAYGVVLARSVTGLTQRFGHWFVPTDDHGSFVGYLAFLCPLTKEEILMPEDPSRVDIDSGKPVRAWLEAPKMQYGVKTYPVSKLEAL